LCSLNPPISAYQTPLGDELLSGQTKSYCSHLDGYSVVTFPKELCKASLDEIRESGEQVVSELTTQRAPQCLVDLTALDYMGSSMVASIVRIWKAIEANQGRMVVAVSSIGVREVLRVTGLSRVWTIKSSYDTALHELGFSSEAKIVKRELRLLAFVGPATLLVGGIAVALGRIPTLAALSQPPDWIAYSLITVAVITSGISIFREHSWRRWLSVFVFLVAATLLGWLIWTALPSDYGWSLRENGKGGGAGEQADGEESDEGSNNLMQDSGDNVTKEPYNTKQNGPPTSSPTNPSDAVASKDDPVESKPTAESSPTNNASNQPTSPPATSDVSPGKKGLPATDSPPQTEGLKP
jgi:anti-anti-sigma factor